MQTITTMTDQEWEKFPKEEDAGFGSIQSSEGNFPLKAMEIKSKIVGLSATTQIVQRFQNAFQSALEVTYIFPLPPAGAMRNFRIRIAEREIVGVLKERGEAREEYEQAISDGHRASIVEEERPDIFTLRVGNIEPGEVIEIRFDLVELLPVVDNEVTYRFPLVVAPKYIPGTPFNEENVGEGTAWDTDRVPDASRISPPVLLPGAKNAIELSIEVTIDDTGMGISNLRSSLHALKGGEGNHHRVEVVPGERLNRDFILRFDLQSGIMKTQFLLSPDDEGNEGTFALTLIPSSGTVQPDRDVVFVLDRSGSMAGWKMVAARRAIGRMIDSLKDSDTFSVVAFDTQLEFFANKSDLHAATNRNRFRAVEWLAKIEARGGTEIMTPLLDAINTLAPTDANRVKTVVLVTDGQVGNAPEILNAVKKSVGNIRVHTIGIDEAVSVAFLKSLSDMGRGVFELVESEDRLDDAMDRIHRNIGTASLSDIQVSFEGITVDRASMPQRLPDAFEGIATVILGRYKDATTASAIIVGVTPEKEKQRINLPAKMIGSTGLSATWARRHIRDLDDMWNISKEKDVEQKLINTSIRFGVLSRFTAFVAVDSTTKIETQQKVQVVQGVEMPNVGRGPRGSSQMRMKRESSKMRKRPRTATPQMPSSVLSYPAPAPATRLLQSQKDDFAEESLVDYDSAEPSSEDLQEKMLWLGRLICDAITGQPFSSDLQRELGDWYDFLSDLFDGSFETMLDFLHVMDSIGNIPTQLEKETNSLQNILSGDNQDLKLSAIRQIAADVSFEETSPILDATKIWLSAKGVFYGTSPDPTPFWKR